MLKRIRVALAAIFLLGITLLFIGIGQEWWGWMAQLQFLPSCLGLNVAVIAGILLLTILCGRLYCSVICPMGVFQDLIIWIRRTAGKLLNKRQVNKLKKLKASGASQMPKAKQYLKRFGFVKEHKIVRYGVLALILAAIFAGVQLFVAILAPYSAYGRMVSAVVRPTAGVVIAVAALTFVVIAVCAWVWGREYCNTICPVGTTLSLFSRFALFRPVIDSSKCVKCGVCYKNCKASCINGEKHQIDYSRCVVCFDCLGNCKEGAIKYKFTGFGGPEKAAKSEDKVDGGRRAFIATTALVGASVAAEAQNMKLDGGLADIIDKTQPERSERLVPFGAKSVKNFYDRCTACQLCVSACPNGVLRPSTDLAHLLQPQMGYEKGYCRPECTACGDICPADAILPVKKEEKLSIHIGTAKVNLELCISAIGQDGCGNCSRHCPVGAIRMVRSTELGHMVPVVAEEQCIGCGACENLCPSRPISAITVDGLSVHRNS